MPQSERIFLAIAAILFTACARPPATDPRLVSEWTRTLYGAVRSERLSPPVASRIFAYASSALYAGLAAADPKAPALAGVLNGLPTLPQGAREEHYDPTLTAVAAERTALDSLFAEGLPSTRASVDRVADSLASARLGLGVSDQIRRRSDALGRQIGIAIIAWAHTDGFDSTRGRKYVAPVGRGLWINDSPVSTYTSQNLSGASTLIAPDNPTNAARSGNVSDRGLIMSRPKRAGLSSLPAVNMAGATEPYWSELRPFVLKAWNECAVPPPPTYSAVPGSPLYDEARQVYDARKALTPDQRTMAFYWADNAGESGTPAGHWISIASQMVSERRLSAEESARLLMLTSVSLADAFISAWGYKYTINLIRPRTYIRALMDSTWEPAIPTPPFPEFLSGHTAVSAAAATTMTALLGDIAFEDSTSISIGHEVRKFPSIQAAADEVAMSRFYGGIHFPSGNSAAKILGRCVGEKVIDRTRALVESR